SLSVGSVSTRGSFGCLSAPGGPASGSRASAATRHPSSASSASPPWQPSPSWPSDSSRAWSRRCAAADRPDGCHVTRSGAYASSSDDEGQGVGEGAGGSPGVVLQGRIERRHRHDEKSRFAGGEDEGLDLEARERRIEPGGGDFAAGLADEAAHVGTRELKRNGR